MRAAVAVLFILVLTACAGSGTGQLKILLTDGERCFRELGLVYHEGRSLSRAAEAFLEMAKQRTAATT